MINSNHAMGNGMTEKFNRTLLDMLGTLEPKKKKEWKAHVGPIVHSYNCTRHTSTGYSPFFLMFGREPRLPVDLAFGLDINQKRQPKTRYAQELRERLKQSYDLAHKAVNNARRQQKRYYDLKARGSCIYVGDRVLVRVVAFDGKHNISDKWEEDVYVVVNKPNVSIPVYIFQKENGEGVRRTLHRNLLLPVGSISDAKQESEPSQRGDNEVEEQDEEVVQSHGHDDSDESDSEGMLPVVATTESTETADTSIEHNTDINDSSSVSVVDSEVTSEHQSDDSCDATEVSDRTIGEDAHEPGKKGDDDRSHIIVEPVDDRSFQSDNLNGGGTDMDEPSVRPKVAPEPVPRRSVRARKKPEWKTSGEFIMATSSSEMPDWIAKANCIKSLSDSVPEAMQGKDLDAILSVVTK